jgi:hypothetical protein
VAQIIEALLPIGVRPRQLSVRTLLLGILLCLWDCRPAHLTRVHEALLGLDDSQRHHLGVEVEWNTGPHTLTYRQTERTFGLVTDALAKSEPDGEPTEILQWVTDALLEATIPASAKHHEADAVDWTDVESFSCHRTKDGRYSDPEASWGHRKGGGPGEKDDQFFGYYLNLDTMVKKEGGEDIAELVRRMLLTSCHVDPPPAFLKVLCAKPSSGIALGDVIFDSGYAHRVPEHWALPLRLAGADLVMDLHPHDRGTKGTYNGAVCFNGALYCPATPTPLFDLEPLSRRAQKDEIAAHDRKAAELARYKLGRITADDPDGYHRVGCPAVSGKVRCPLRQASMRLSAERPEILSPPEHPPACCVQKTLTVPPQVNAKTAQKHDYPSAAHRRSYARRTAVERANSTIKDPATNDISKGWCRVMGLAPMTEMLACLLVVRNVRVSDAFELRQAENQRRAAAGLPPKTRRRRRKTLTELVGAPTTNAPP